MKAAVVHTWGGPEALKYEEVADPIPGPGQVLVSLKTASVNYHDVLVRQTGRGLDLPNILGIDGAGTREDTGEEVVLYPALNWGDDPEFFGPSFEVLGDASDGTYAEKIVVPESSVFRKPASLSWEEAGALPIAGLTAFRALFTRGKLEAGEAVLVLGAGSGVSTLAVSFAVAAGARVFVTSSSSEKIEKSVELGAEGGFLYTDPQWVEQVQAGTGGVDLVIDGVGSSLQDAVDSLRMGGRVVVFGTSGGGEATVGIPSIFFGQKSVIGTTSGSPSEFQRMLSFVDAQGIKPVIDSVWPLHETAAAHRHMEGRKHFGKIVLQVS
ncbi:zinc-binding dehydrogenase [Citricoccus sp. NPDC055426]|uniref:quinone oxidoreductase family protein n=1 Tax=Citricoccus sp. NPDC055426 TaxID=3155536 RepID=UPI00343127AB